MARNETARPDQPLRETEQAAYHAFREWPIWLVLREKELAALQTIPPGDDGNETPKHDAGIVLLNPAGKVT